MWQQGKRGEREEGREEGGEERGRERRRGRGGGEVREVRSDQC